MKKETYDMVYPQLKGLHSIDFLGRRYGIPKETLRVLLTQKVIRETKRKYNFMREALGKLLSRWRHGESFVALSRSLGFPPVMVSSLILSKMGVSRRLFRAYLKDPSSCGDGRIRGEVSDALKHDFVYSPRASVEQAERGKIAEQRVGEWVRGWGVSFKTEAECRKGNAGKTPDFLLSTPIILSGKKLCWVDSKATFGDEKEVRSDYRKQLRHYVELFGPGAVVYWYGFLEGNAPEHILLLSSADIKPQSNK